MGILEFLKQVDEDVETVLEDDFEIEITKTKRVPSFDDPFITHDNLTDGTKKCKLLESCVLYIDIRNSAQISVKNDAEKLARMYSSFVKNMISAARYYGGHVRNIIGDRIMVVFDREECFINAYKTAVLMNTIAKHIINKRIRGIDFKCGIGIDFGEMLIVKTGAIRHGSEKGFYRGLVWLGRPANVASRLTDLANKSFNREEDIVSQATSYTPLSPDTWEWKRISPIDFVKQLDHVYPSRVVSKNPQHACFFLSTTFRSWSYAPILMTADFYRGFVDENPNDKSIQKGWITINPRRIKEYKDHIYECDIYFTEVNDI